MSLSFWYWRHLKYWQIFRLKHYWLYDEDGSKRIPPTRAEMEDALLKFQIATEVLDNIAD